MSDVNNVSVKDVGIRCYVGICNIFISIMPFIGLILLILDNISTIENHVKILLSLFVIIQMFFIIFECGCIFEKLADAYLCVKTAQFLFYGLLVIVSIFFAIFGHMKIEYKFYIGNGLVIFGILLSCCSCFCVLSLKEASTDENSSKFSSPVLQVFQFNNFQGERGHSSQDVENSVIVEEINEEGEENQKFIPAIEDTPKTS